MEPRSAQSLREEIHGETGRNGKGVDFNRLQRLLDEFAASVRREAAQEQREFADESCWTIHMRTGALIVADLIDPAKSDSNSTTDAADVPRDGEFE